MIRPYSPATIRRCPVTMPLRRHQIATAFLALALCSPVLAQSAETPESRLVDYEPAWSPDGSQIAFISNRTGALKLWVMDTNGSNPRQITHGNDEDDAPAWAPDGVTLAFVSIRDGNADLFTIRTDGSGARRLTTTPGDDIHPQWAPDGSRILFNSARNSRDPQQPDVYEIFSIRPDGSDLQQHSRGGIATYASYSPDGTTFVFRRQLPDGNSEIMVRAVRGGEERNVSHDPAFDGWPAWSRDGRYIVFAREANDTDAAIWVVNVDGTGAHPLIAGPGRNTNARWSPTADQIVFSRRLDHQVRLFVRPVSP